MPILDVSHPMLHHAALNTTFRGVEHQGSNSDAAVQQFRGIKYASVPVRFRQSKLFTRYPAVTDATKYGPICPQVQHDKSFEEELFGISDQDIPKQILKHNEFECLNLNITCPAGLTPQSRLPVMVWIHGGGDRGCGSSWVYDGGALVRKSILIGKPVIIVTINFRIGLFGFAASPMIREDNKLAGEEGVGNYGLRDQRRAIEWIHHYISGFGGDPANITLFGESSGAADIFYHLLSAENERRPYFHRAIVQSAIIEFNLPNVAGAGWQLSRIMSALRITTLDELRHISSDRLIALGGTAGVVDDGVFLRQGWKDSIIPEDSHQHHHYLENHLHEALLHPISSGHKSNRSSTSTTPVLRFPGNLQPLIIGDCAYDSLLWTLPASMWTPSGVVRRLKAVCMSLSKASNLLNAYDITSSTADEEIVERVLELINDARVSWPTECIAQGAKRARGGHGVWRYVFDQEGPARGVPHHAVDLIYLFDNVPLPASSQTSWAMTETFCDGRFDDLSGEEDLDVNYESVYSAEEDEDVWGVPSVDEWSYGKVRDAIQERWITFANGDAPWDEDRVFVFGPEGEIGERSSCIFDGRRRKAVWKEALEPLGLQLVQKVGVELSRGPPLNTKFA